MKKDMTLQIEVRFRVSLWECIKLRIAGRNADLLCRLIFYRMIKQVKEEGTPNEPNRD